MTAMSCWITPTGVGILPRCRSELRWGFPTLFLGSVPCSYGLIDRRRCLYHKEACDRHLQKIDRQFHVTGQNLINNTAFIDIPNGITQLTWFVPTKKLLEMTVVLKKSARARSRCWALAMNSNHFFRAAWFEA